MKYLESFTLPHNITDTILHITYTSPSYSTTSNLLIPPNNTADTTQPLIISQHIRAQHPRHSTPMINHHAAAILQSHRRQPSILAQSEHPRKASSSRRHGLKHDSPIIRLDLERGHRIRRHHGSVLRIGVLDRKSRRVAVRHR